LALSFHNAKEFLWQDVDDWKWHFSGVKNILSGSDDCSLPLKNMTVARQPVALVSDIFAFFFTKFGVCCTRAGDHQAGHSTPCPEKKEATVFSA